MLQAAQIAIDFLASPMVQGLLRPLAVHAPHRRITQSLQYPEDEWDLLCSDAEARVRYKLAPTALSWHYQKEVAAVRVLESMTGSQ